MPFWSSETLTQRAKAECLIKPFLEDRVKSAAYELELANQIFLTSDRPAKRRNLTEREQLGIPPGQFALLMCMEEVTVPSDAIGFISIKAGIKFRGMVNISGFHVDPGFRGRLKFSVYNAGSRPIVLEPGAPTFLLWFASLDRETEDVYNGSHQNQAEITAADVMSSQGEVPSPAALDARLKDVEYWVKAAKAILYLALAGLFAAFAMVLVPRLFPGHPAPSQQPPAVNQTIAPQSQQDSKPTTPSDSEKKEHLPLPESGRISK
jgi:dCTP deaminase